MEVMNINPQVHLMDRSLNELRTEDYLAYKLGKIPQNTMNRISQKWHANMRSHTNTGSL